MPIYDHKTTEKKWQHTWATKKVYNTDLGAKSKKPKYYNLVMFPYPSGDKLHIGHWYNYAPADSWGRYMKMKGYEVFEPMGYDSFGLPAENYAIKTGVHPTISIKNNIEKMREQLRAVGTMYDWSQEVVTSDPEYYKWTQWVFLQLYKKGLAYRRNAPVNWCPSCQTVLANEQVVDGRCERCKHEVTKRDLTQWFFKIRDYAERLLDFKDLVWPEKTKLMQHHWIGRSEGSEVVFELCDRDGERLGKSVTVFTTRVDTLFSGAFVVLAPEHELVREITTKEHAKNVEQYIEKTKKETDIERTAEDREKTGVFTGCYAINPINKEVIPVWIGDFVLVHYGTGAVFGDAHDTRDFMFGKKYKIPLRTTIKPADADKETEQKIRDLETCFTGEGVLYDSGEFDGLTSEEARQAITKALAKKQLGQFIVNYKLRDWLVSRQRYWGAPIPIVYCEKCGEVAVPEDQLPVELPRDVDFTPKGDGKSPLNTVESFVHAKCPQCGGKAMREVDTMDTFVDSSWYFLRYPSARVSDKPFDKNLLEAWGPVDMYIGGPEHACMHLLYARFINMVLHDLKHVPFEEPFQRLVHQGMVTKDGAKMSKSKGNVVSPDEFVSKYGSDVFRMYLMFMGPFTEGGDWSDKGITGIARFVERFYILMRSKDVVGDEAAMWKNVHRTVKRVSEDMEKFQFNTCVAGLMEFVNAAQKTGINHDAQKILVKLIAPLAPHLAEQLWEEIGGKFSVFDSEWPKYDEKYLVDDTLTLAIQVNGKLRGQITVAKDAPKETILSSAKAEEKVAKYLEGVEMVKEIYVPGKLVSFVVKQ